MARYSIDGQTLTNIGDAIRGHTSETRIDVGNWEFDIIKDSLDADGNYTHDGCFGKYHIPGAKRIVISNIVATIPEYGYMAIAPGNYIASDLYYKPSGETIPGIVRIMQSNNDPIPAEIVFEDTEDFTYLVKRNSQKVYSALSAHVVAYDENGEILATREYETKNTFTPDQMADVISDMAIVPEEAFHYSGYCYYRFYQGSLDWLINLYGDRITTENINNANCMFSGCKVKRIPFELNFDPTASSIDMGFLFHTNTNLEEIPKINGKPKVKTMSNMFASCSMLRNLPENIADWFDWSYIDTATGAYSGGSRGNTLFSYCSSLRSVPMEFLAHANPYASGYSSEFSSLFSGCNALDEIVGLPIPRASDMNWTSNSFGSTFITCSRLKNMTFATNEDGSPIQVNWKSQTIDLSSYVGYLSDTWGIRNNSNSGITADKEVKDDATYQALKDDPDYFTGKVEYSRYDHDSAVRTINSLPDTTISGGTNTIKFKGASGSATDAGAINTLTAEEIAVATAKGWTVSLT